MREMNFRGILSVVYYRDEHLGHCIVDALNAAISRRVVGACGGFVDVKEIVDGAGPLSVRRIAGYSQRRM